MEEIQYWLEMGSWSAGHYTQAPITAHDVSALVLRLVADVYHLDVYA